MLTEEPVPDDLDKGVSIVINIGDPVVFDSMTVGSHHVTFNSITINNDSTTVPEPTSSTLLVVLLVYGLGCRRCLIIS